MDNAVLTITHSYDADDLTIGILKFQGFLNFESYDIAKININRMIEAGIFKIVIDLSETGYISSSGWAVFIGALGTVQAAGGDIRLAGMTDEVAFIFDALDLKYVIKSYGRIEAAIESFKK